MKDFVHLHVHSEYSLLDGAARIKELAAEAARMGMPALALTDHGVMYGAIAFYKACRENGIKPIIGCEMYITDDLKIKTSREEHPHYHLVLLARNLEGYRNLMKLCSAAHLEGFYYKPRIDFELLSRHAEGLICLSSCLGGEIAQHLLHGRDDQALRTAERYRALFGEDYYLEIQDHGLADQKRVMQGVVELARKSGIPLAATNDVHYIRRSDYLVQDVLLCIGTGKTVEDKERFRFQSDQLYLKSGEEMAGLFAHAPQAVENTRRIAEKCELELETGRSILPRFTGIPAQLTAGEYLLRLCRQGLKERFEQRPEWRDDAFRERLEERLAYELNVIQSMGFSDYFLIVWDFIRFAHERKIAVGPGRGSSAGSLVAYVLRITDVDPIRYRLLFERFLNPERVTMPDIDIDFSDERRDEVIEYVVGKYGPEHVAQIVTFGTMAARAAVRDVGRALNVPLADVDRAAKMIPMSLGMTIEEALRVNPDLKQFCERNAAVAKLIEMARRVEGLPRHSSTHAAGVVISKQPLTDYVPLQEGTEHTALTQYSMEHLETLGLLKMDFLGLRTLSIIERTLQWIREQFQREIDFHRIADDDPATYEMLSRGDTTGIFQLESAGMRRALKDMKPSAFEDIISVLALYRPGPMEFIPKYIQSKHGQIRVDYPHPALKPLLQETYGIIVYQEQIMQIASVMAGFSLGEADLLRRAVSKKKREVLDEQRAHFVGGSVNKGFTEEEANAVYDMIVRFADYGFPRAHAVAYGVLAFQTAYLKAHYPVQFMAAMLTAVMGSHRKVAEYVDECRRMGIDVLPPDVNESGVLFTPVRSADGAQRGAIRFGLAAIKNVGTHAMESIIGERCERPYANLLDFCRRVDLRVCNKRVIESLIQAGAMDSLPGHRAQLLDMLEEAVEKAAKWRKEREDLQIHLFGFDEEIHWEMDYPDVRPFDKIRQLELEKEGMGLYVSGHPMDQYEADLRKFGVDAIHLLDELPEQSSVTAAGMVLSCKTIVTRKGRPMAFMELEDRVAKIEVVLFPEVWEKYADMVRKGGLLLVQAKLQHQDEGVKLIADRLLSLEDPEWPARMRGFAAPAAGAAGGRRRVERSAAPPPVAAGQGKSPVRADSVRADRPARSGKKEQKVYIKIPGDRENAGALRALQGLLKQHPGPLGVVLFYEKEQKMRVLQRQYNVKPSPSLFGQVEKLLGKQTVVVR